MTSSTTPIRGVKCFGSVTLVWFLTTYPSPYMLEIYNRHHHTLGAVGLHPELVDAYILRATWLALAISVFATVLLFGTQFFISRRPGLATHSLLIVGLLFGISSTAILYSCLNPLFVIITKFGLDAPGFLYDGAFAGFVCGYLLYRGHGQTITHTADSIDSSKSFLFAALVCWAIILKIGERLYALTLAPGLSVFPGHFFMFLPVLLWTPRACRYLWRTEPSRLLVSVLRACALGIFLPPLIGLLLFPFVALVQFARINLYPMLWGNLVFFAFFSFHNSGYYLLCLLPGFIWGVVVGIVRWRYLGVMKADAA
jgi:hypothetical protein